MITLIAIGLVLAVICFAIGLWANREVIVDNTTTTGGTSGTTWTTHGKIRDGEAVGYRKS